MTDIPNDPTTQHGGREDRLPNHHPDKKSCTCDNWESGTKNLNAALSIAHIHGQDYSIEAFQFCPWCGLYLTTTSVSDLDLPND